MLYQITGIDNSLVQKEKEEVKAPGTLIIEKIHI
jgi:hypothetical protein